MYINLAVVFPVRFKAFFGHSDARCGILAEFHYGRPVSSFVNAFDSRYVVGGNSALFVGGPCKGDMRP